MKGKLACLVLACALMSACSGVRTTKETFTAHAESFRILGYPVPHDDQAAAWERVPKGAKVTSVHSTPADWDSFWGFIGNLFMFHQTNIGGTRGDY